MKVLLAYRCNEEAADSVDATTVPAGLRWIAASLRAAGHSALVANFSRLGWKDVEKYLTTQAPDLVGVSCLTHNRATSARLARIVRRTNPAAVVAMGAAHAAALPDLLLRRVRELDLIVVGEGEGALVRACEAISTGGLPAAAAIPGVALKGMPAAAPSLAPRPDALPRPVVGLDGAGLDPQRDFRHVVASRPRPGGPAVRSAGSVADELAELRDEFGVMDVSLVGPGLLGRPLWLAEVAGELAGRRIAASWEIAADVPDLLALDDEDLAVALRSAHSAGCRRVRVVLDATDADAAWGPRLAEISGLLRPSGIGVHATLRHGRPDAGAADVQLLRGLVRALQPREGSVEAIGILPGTPQWSAFAAAESLDEKFWFDESRPEVFAASADQIEVSEGALVSTLREVARSARPASRDLESLEATGPATAWGQVEWGDWRASLGDMQEAERRYRVAASIEPWNPFPWQRLASLHSRERARRRRGRDAPAQSSDEGQRESAALRQVLARVPKHGPSLARVKELRPRALPRKTARGARR